MSYADDADVLPRRVVNETEGLGLFDFPTVPRVERAENRVLPLSGTPDGAYEAWRASAAGQEAFETIKAEALRWVAVGSKRISTKALFEWYRGTYHKPLNNTATALIARELVDTVPALAERIELRQRAA